MKQYGISEHESLKYNINLNESNFDENGLSFNIKFHLKLNSNKLEDYEKILLQINKILDWELYKDSKD